MRRAVFALALLALHAAPAGAGLLEDVMAGKGRIVDLAWELAPGVPFFPGGAPFQIASLARLKDEGYDGNLIVTGEHTGTHVDAPSHVLAGKSHIQEIAPKSLVAEAVVIDISSDARASADYQLALSDVSDWELTHGKIPEGAIVFLFSGWGRRWADPDAYLHKDKSGVLHFPGFSMEAARYLIEQRDARAFGTDTLSIDYGPSAAFEVHKYAMGKGRYAIENVANLEQLPPKGAVVIVAPLAIHGGSGAPARIFAFVPEGLEPGFAPPGLD